VSFETISQSKSITKNPPTSQTVQKNMEKILKKENDNVEKGFHSYRCQKEKLSMFYLKIKMLVIVFSRFISDETNY
jgi:hypothetical protein